MGFSEGNDGTFFMLWEDFIKYFRIIWFVMVSSEDFSP